MRKSDNLIKENMDNIDLNNAIKLTGGVSHDTYKIGDKVYRSTIDFKDEMTIFNNESMMLFAIKRRNITEEILEFDLDTGEKLSKYIEGGVSLDVEDNEDLIKALDLVKKIHELRVPGLGDFKPFERMNYWRDNSRVPLLNKEYKKRINAAKELYEKYPLVPCHNDLLLSNFIKTSERYYLIDFEFAGMNIELFDIASFISENNIDDFSKITAILHYFDDKYTLDELKIMMKFLDILWYYWANFKYKYTGKKVYLEIANDKLRRIRQ